MMTLLMVLFIVLFAISQVDQQKFAELKEGLTAGFGSTSTVPLSGGKAILDATASCPAPIDLTTGMGTKDSGEGKAGGQASRTRRPTPAADASSRSCRWRKQEAARLEEIEKQIRAALDAKHLRSDVRFRITDRGLVVALVSDDVFFENASAELRPARQRRAARHRAGAAAPAGGGRGRGARQPAEDARRRVPHQLGAVRGARVRRGALPHLVAAHRRRPALGDRVRLVAAAVPGVRLPRHPLQPAGRPRPGEPAAGRSAALLPQIAPQLSDD